MKALISIVIPVFNTQKQYLLECFESVRLQSYENTEVIIVDDGSDEATASFLEAYSHNLENWKVVHKQNNGLSEARHTGFSESKGEYVTFVDSDDRIDESFIQKLHQACVKNDTDYSVVEFTKFTDSTDPVVWGNEYKDLKVVERDNYELIKSQLIKDGSRLTKHRTFEGLVWGKLYTRSLLNKVDWDFCNYRITEDEFFSIQIHLHTSGAAFIYEQLYFYRVTQAESLGQKVKPNVHGAISIPYIQIAREVYEKFTLLFNKFNFEYDNDDLIVFYTKVLLDRTRRLVNNGEIDQDNRKEYEYQASMLLPLILKSEKVSLEWKLLAQLAFKDQRLAIVTEDGLIAKRSVLDELDKSLV